MVGKGQPATAFKNSSNCRIYQVRRVASSSSRMVEKWYQRLLSVRWVMVTRQRLPGQLLMCPPLRRAVRGRTPVWPRPREGTAEAVQPLCSSPPRHASPFQQGCEARPRPAPPQDHGSPCYDASRSQPQRW